MKVKKGQKKDERGRGKGVLHKTRQTHRNGCKNGGRVRRGAKAGAQGVTCTFLQFGTGAAHEHVLSGDGQGPRE